MRVDDNSETVINKKGSVEAETLAEIQFLHDVLNYALGMPGLSGENADKIYAAKAELNAIISA